MCLGGGATPQAPDTSAQSAASGAIGTAGAAAGADQLNWAKGQAGANGATTSNVQGQLNPMIGQQTGAGAAATDQFTNQTLGGLNTQLKQAQDWGSPQGIAGAQANAEATTGQAYNAARMNNQRQLGSYGVDPSTMRSGALNLNANLQQAGAVGNAGYQAGQARQQQGLGMTSAALGQNLQAAGVGQGFQAGANATGSNIVGLGNQTTATGSQALSAPSTMMNVGLAGQGQDANIQNQGFQNQMASYNAGQAGSNALMGGIGQIGGMAAMAMMADGGGIPGRQRFADGGKPQQTAMVPTMDGLPQIQAGATFQDPNAGGFGQGLSAGADKMPMGGLPPRPQGIASTGAGAVGSNTGAEASKVGMPAMQDSDFPMLRADGGGIPGRGNPAVPPTVNMPGPWVAANGGPTPGPGMVDQGPSDGTGIDDQIPARVSVGEYIIPADVVHAKGKLFFDKLLKDHHVPAQQQRQQMGMH